MNEMQKELNDYGIQVHTHPAEIAAAAWDQLLAQQDCPTPFMQHAYLQAMHESGSATPDSGWTPRFITLWVNDALVAACPMYLKKHSYGEYVFDWAWANAYQQHGLPYYPKALIAVPFTPVPGSRLLAVDAPTRQRLLQAVIAWCAQEKLSSLHLLFGSPADMAACEAEELLQRQTVQFHWHNQAWPDFEAFLASLNQEKRKKIRQERRKVAEAGVTFRWSLGAAISSSDWRFFYECYERTYLEHGNAPYLTPAFFQSMQTDMAHNWLLFIAERDGVPMASSLIGIHHLGEADAVAYGRYWGALERVDCLHFEACYYQPLQWCMQHGVQRFEGGAQGEHKMARALMPTSTHSGHWLADHRFAQAVAEFLEREGRGVDNYMAHLDERNPFKRPD
ncbi:Peptidogalycan biosysnthesis/recognition [Burkholderiaceae bacterium]